MDFEEEYHRGEVNLLHTSCQEVPILISLIPDDVSLDLLAKVVFVRFILYIGYIFFLFGPLFFGRKSLSFNHQPTLKRTGITYFVT